MFTVIKIYTDLPAAHRQPDHDGHCRQIHGHNWGFHIYFTCSRKDSNGFVVDVGDLSAVKQFLVDKFDHTIVLNATDILAQHLEDFLQTTVGHSNVVVVPNCGMEGLAEYVFHGVEKILDEHFTHDVDARGLRVLQVTCWEDSKNAATFRPLGANTK